jgi:predicted kinase
LRRTGRGAGAGRLTAVSSVPPNADRPTAAPPDTDPPTAVSPAFGRPTAVSSVPPPAVLLGGAPGTGKSTLAAALAPRLRAAVLDLDVATGPLTTVVSELIGVPDLSDPRLAELTRTPRYDTLFSLAEDNLRAGIPVVLVAPFTAERSPSGWRSVEARLAPHAAALTLVWLHLPAHLLVERPRRRGAARDTDKVRDPAGFLAGAGGAPAVPHLPLDASMPVAELVDHVVAKVAHDRLAIDGKP